MNQGLGKIVHPLLPPLPTLDVLVGSIDRIDFTEESLGVDGWVASRTGGAPIDSAVIYLDSSLLGSVTLGLVRPDVAKVNGPEFLLSGWTGKFRCPALPPGHHLVELYGCAGLDRHAISAASRFIVIGSDGAVRTVGKISPDSQPIPPTDLITTVAGTPDVDWFLLSGAMAAWTIEWTLSRVLKKLNDFDCILDFGCGCGRVIRHLERRRKLRINGSDYNPLLVEWCRRNLDFAEFETNALWPQLSYQDNMFDLIYVFSVLTHMTIPLQREWMQEFSRVLRKGGFLLVSTHGRRYRRFLSEEDAILFDAGEIIIHRPHVAGTNECSAYHPPESIPHLLPENMSVISFIPEGAKGNPYQDLFLLMKL
jgi:SAM-dependent methyltransferase